MRKTMDDDTRFWARVQKDRFGENECWAWPGTGGPHGYGVFRVGSQTDGTRRQLLAHRFADQSVRGPIPRGVNVLHRCDNPKCVNPRHLWRGTHQENMADKIAKGRQRSGKVWGEKHHKAKLTEADVRHIRARVESVSAAAAKFGVSKFTINNIRSGKGWAHLNGTTDAGRVEGGD